MEDNLGLWKKFIPVVEFCFIIIGLAICGLVIFQFFGLLISGFLHLFI